MLAVFPFIFNAFAGVKSTDSLLINVIRSYGGTEKDLYLKVILPSTMPYIIAGARLAIGRGLVGIIVGEFYAASEGIGFAITQAGDTYRLTGHVRRHHHPVSYRRRADRTHAQTGAYGRAVARD